MSDQDFVISFRADTQAALNQMRLLVEMAVAAETAINRVQAAAAAGSGVKAIGRSAAQSVETFKALGVNMDVLDAKLEKLGPNFAASFERAIRRLPTTLGDMQLFRNAGQEVPASKINSAVRAFKGLALVFEEDATQARRFQTEAARLQRELFSLSKIRIRSFLEQAERAGARSDLRLQINSLRQAESELRKLQRAGIPVNGMLDGIRVRLRTLGEGTNTTRAEIEGLRKTIQRLRDTAAARFQLGNFDGQLRALKQLQELLVKLQGHGANVTRNLGLVAGQIASTTGAITAAATAQGRIKDLDRHTEAARKAREGVLVANNVGPITAQIAALRKLEDALVRLRMRGSDTRVELTKVRQDIVALGGAAANTAAINKLLERRLVNERRITERANEGKPESRLLNARGELINLQLVARGHTQAAAAAAVHAAALARMGPVINAEIASLLRERDALLKNIQARETVGLRPTGTQLGRGFEINQALSQRATGPTAAHAAADMQRFSLAIDANRTKLATWDSAFGHHARRIAEGLLIYNSFGVALGAVAESFKEIATLDTELARFEAVAGNLTDTQADKFLRDLADVAINTATPLSELISTTDLVGASFNNIADAAERAQAVAGFSDIAGQFSNVIGQEGNQEAVTRQLVALFRQTRIEGQSTNEQLDRFRGFLDLVVTAGDNASSVISEVIEGLREIGPGAKSSGADLGLLAFAMAEVIQETGESGLSIGNTFKTVLANLTTGSKVADVFEDIPRSIVALTDQNGNLLASTDILTNLFAAVENGSITIGNAQEIFRDLGPVIQPGQQGVVNEIFNAIGRGLERVQEEGPKAGGALQELNDIILDTLGKRFEQVMIRFESLLVTKMADPIVSVGNTLIGVLDAIVGFLENDFFRSITFGVVQFLLIVGAAGLFLGALKRIGLGIVTARALIASLATPALLAATHLRGLGVASGAVAATTPALRAWGGNAPLIAATGNAAAGAAIKLTAMGLAVRAATVAIRFFLPVLLLMAAVDFGVAIASAHAFSQAIQDITQHKDLGTVGFEGEQKDLGKLLELANSDLQLTDIFDSEETKTQARNVEHLAEKIRELADAKNLTREKADALTAVILDENRNIKTSIVLAEDFDNALLSTTETQAAFNEELDFDWDEYVGGLLETTEAVDELTAAETRAADALRVQAGLSSLRAQHITELTRQLDEGAISLDEFTDGMSNVDAASEAAAQFVSAFGDNLALIPGLVERIAQTGESPGAALTGLLLENPDTIGQQIDIINQMVALVELIEETQDVVESNPIEVKTSMDVAPILAGSAVYQGTLQTMLGAGDIIAQNPVTPRLNLVPFLEDGRVYLGALRTMMGVGDIIAHNLANTGRAITGGKVLKSTAVGSTDKVGAKGNDLLSGILGELEALGRALGETGTIREGDPRFDSSTTQTPQTGLLDIGDLAPGLIPQIVAMAAAAQAQILAAGGTVDSDDITALLKDGAFQQLVSGVDQRLLTEALQQLTEVEKRRLELEQQRLQDVTRSIVTQVGPIQSLVSSPVLAAGGGVLSGQGLNADPRLGNFTINVPINWSGMSLTQLQAFIQQTIHQAWIAAGRGG